MRPKHSRENNNYQSYLLRFWRENENTSWRVLLVHVPTGEEQRFPSTDALFLYLHQQTLDPDGSKK
jgi:hypothetical protein